MSLSREETLERVRLGALLVNVQSSEAFAEKHIEGSVNVPLVKIEDHFVAAIEALTDRNRPIITYGSGSKGASGTRAGNILRSRGFRADDYPGGTDDWHRAGLPVEGTRIPAGSTAKAGRSAALNLEMARR
jgi:rhodanese-related sulfurtransferase